MSFSRHCSVKLTFLALPQLGFILVARLLKSNFKKKYLNYILGLFRITYFPVDVYMIFLLLAGLI